MSAIGASMGFFFTSASALKKMKSDGDGNKLFKTMAVLGMVFSVIFMVLQLIPIPGLEGVHFVDESYFMLLVWVVLGIVFYFTKKKTIEKE
jgi:uncharacterized membrane protein